MILDGLTLSEGSTAQNLTVAFGTSFPSSPNLGELFYNTSVLTKGLYTYNGSIWDKVVFTSIDLDTLLPNIGTAGTYRSVTTDSKGRVTAGTNPTTLAGYGITDAQALDADLTAIAGLAGTSGFLKKTAVNTWSLDTNTYLTGNQTINISGDISGSGTTAITLTLPASGVSAGTYKSVTVNSKGLVTGGTNPTTLVGFGITDAQPLDADLTSLSNLLTTGITVRSAANTFVTRTLGVSGVGLSITNADGSAGDITITSNATSANTASTVVARDSSGNFTATQITASLFGNASTANAWTVGRTISLSTDASGSSGIFDGSANVTIPLTLATVNSNVGSFGSATQVPLITVDGKGRTTAASNVSIAIPTSAVTSGTFADARIASSNVTQHQASLTILETQITDGSLLARNAGNETISGSWTFSNPVVGATPTLGTHLTTKDYVDNLVTGLDMKGSCRAVATSPITLSGTQTVDGVSLIVGDRVLVVGQSTASANGIYVVSAGAWTRSTDADTSADVTSGMYTFVEGGSTYASSGWVLATNPPITLGTTSLVFTQFNGLGQITAGSGLTKTGNQLDIGTVSSSRIVVNADNIDLATVGTSGTYRSVTTDAYGRVTAGTNPTTLSGYGITDAQGLDADLTAIAGLIGTSGFLKKIAADTWSLDTTAYAPASTAVTGISIVSANGVSGSVTSTTTPAITLTLGAITPTSVAATGTISGTTITATTQFSGPGTGLTGTAASLTAGTATSLAGGGTISTTTGSFSGTLTVKTPPTAAAITGATSGSIEVPSISGISSPTHATFLHQTTSTSFGYVQHVSLGSYRAGTANWDSFYIGIGGNDSNPTTKYSFNFDGVLTHSTTGTFLNSTNYNTYVPTLTGTGASGTWSINVTGNSATATALATGRTFSLSTDATGTSAAFTGAGNVTIPMTLATVNSNVGSFGSASQVPVITVNAKGLVTAVSTVGVSSAAASSTLTTTNDTVNAATVYPTWTTATSGNLSYFVSDTKLSFVPSTGTLTATKFAGALNGTVGATTPNTGAFTTLSTSGTATIGGTSVPQRGLRIQNTLTGNAGQVGVDSQPTFDATALSYGMGYYVGPATAAATFTMPNGYGMYIDDWNKGLNSVITTQTGLYIANQTKGTTNIGINCATTVDSSSTTTGSIITAGGLGVAKKAFFGDTVTATSFSGTHNGPHNGTVGATTPNTGAFTTLTTNTTGSRFVDLSIGADADIYLYESSANTFSIRTGTTGLFKYFTFSDTGLFNVVSGGITTAGNSALGDAEASDTHAIKGATTILSNSASAALTVTQTGAGNAFVVEDSASTDTTPFVIDGTGRTIIGHTTSVNNSYATSPILQVHTNTGGADGSSEMRWTADVNGPSHFFMKSRSATTGTQTVVQNGDNLGTLLFAGSDGTGFINAASIAAYVDAAPGTNDMPGRLVLSTTADGASSPTGRVTIDSIGEVLFSSCGVKIQTSRRVTSDVDNQWLELRGGTGASSANIELYGGTHATNAGLMVLDASEHRFRSVAGTEWMRIDSTGNIGIGGASAAGYKVLNYGNWTGSTTFYGIASQGVIQSDVNAAVASYRSAPTTAAISFTLPNLYGYIAEQGTIGAGSSITSQFGFHAAASLVGATNNYGFYGNIPSGVNRWNFFAGGTANNAFAGNVRIGSTAAPVATLDVTGTLAVTGAITGTSFNSITALSSTTPAALGVAAVGTSTTVARSDHVHAAPTTITGNAGSATNIVGGATGSIPYQSAASTTTMLAAGTNGQVLTLASGVPTWAAAATGGATLTDDTTTNANTFYPTMSSNQTSGALTTAVVSSTKLSYNPSTGTLNATNFNTTSDERAKDNIRDIGYGLNEVLRMSGKKFEMKDSGQTSIGLIAQDVLKIIPEVVNDNGNDRLGINYPVLTAVLIEAVKELTARVAELEQRCKVLNI